MIYIIIIISCSFICYNVYKAYTAPKYKLSDEEVYDLACAMLRVLHFVQYKHSIKDGKQPRKTKFNLGYHMGKAFSYANVLSKVGVAWFVPYTNWSKLRKQIKKDKKKQRGYMIYKYVLNLDPGGLQIITISKSLFDRCVIPNEKEMNKTICKQIKKMWK